MSLVTKAGGKEILGATDWGRDETVYFRQINGC